MATFSTSDDDQELERLRLNLLGDTGQREKNRSAARAATATAAPPAAYPESPVADFASGPPHAQEEFLPNPGPPREFAAVRPRVAGVPAAQAKHVANVVEPALAPTALPNSFPFDAMPEDVVDERAATQQTSEAAFAERVNRAESLDGVDVEHIKQLIAQNPELFGVQAADDPGAVDAFHNEAAFDEGDVEQVSRRDRLASSDLATQGWRAWLVRLGIPIRKGAAERFSDLLESAHEAIRRDLDEPVVIGVTSYRGSCGKTSVTVMLARLLAEIRDETVLALDTDLHGTLLSRSVAEGDEARSQGMTMHEVAEQLRFGSVDLRTVARDGGGGYAFIPGSQTFRANSLSVSGYRMIIDAARQVYPIVLVDMSQLCETELYSAVLESLDGLVMMSPAAEDGVGYLYRTQSELQNRGVDELNSRRITVLNNVSSVRTQVDTEEFARGLKHRDKRDVAEIPYDRHLATSAPIDMDQTAVQSKHACTFFLAALMSTFEDRDWGQNNPSQNW